jgi:hypothetical protein
MTCIRYILNHNKHITYSQPCGYKRGFGVKIILNLTKLQYLHFKIEFIGVFDISFLVNIMMFRMLAIVPKMQIYATIKNCNIMENINKKIKFHKKIINSLKKSLKME